MREPRTLRMASGAAFIVLFSLEAGAQPEPPPAEPAAPITVEFVEATPLDVPREQLLQVTGRLALRVDQLDASVLAIGDAFGALGARLRSRQDESLSFHVPRDRFEDAMNLAADQGFELDRSVEVRDRTPKYLEVLALLRSAEQTRNRIAALHRGVGGVRDPLRVESALTRWDARVAELERRRREILQHTSLAVLHVHLQPTETIVQEELPDFRLPFPWLDELSLQRLMDFEKRGGGYEDEPEDGGVESDAQIDLQIKVLRATDEVLLGGNETAMAAGLTMRGVGDTTPIGFAAGMDLALGGGFSGGFLYNYRMLGGLGTGISDFWALGIVTGLGIGGLTGGHVPFGIEIPVEAFTAVEAGDIMRAGAWARTSWVLASDDRQSGSDTAPFGDEFSTGLSLLFGEMHGSYNQDRTGLSLHGAYHELMGTHAYEVSVGFGVSFLELERTY